MKKLGFALLIGLVVFSASTIGCSRDRKETAAPTVSSAVPYTIEVGGSTSVTPLMELLSAEYQKQKPHIKVNINGTGSGDGIKNAGVLYQIGMSSRPLTPTEQGEGSNEEIIALDGIAVIVNQSNPVSDLTVEQIRNIYTGVITDWSEVSGGARQGRSSHGSN